MKLTSKLVQECDAVFPKVVTGDIGASAVEDQIFAALRVKRPSSRPLDFTSEWFSQPALIFPYLSTHLDFHSGLGRE